MSALLDAIREEISEREARSLALTEELDLISRQLDELETMAQTAQSLNGAGAESTSTVEAATSGAGDGGQSSNAGRKGGNAPDGRRSTSAGRRSGSAPSSPRRAPHSEGGGPTKAAVLAFVKTNGKVSVADVANSLGSTKNRASTMLRELLQAGQVQAEGATSARRYFTTDTGDAVTAARQQSKGTGVAGSLPRLKQRVQDAIARDPGALNEERLALALDVDREDIAVACGELLDTADILLQPDGTYTIDRGGGARNVDLNEAILAVLRKVDSAISTKEVAYQVNKAGSVHASDSLIDTALRDLETASQVAHFAGMGGKSTWRAAE